MAQEQTKDGRELSVLARLLIYQSHTVHTTAVSTLFTLAPSAIIPYGVDCCWGALLQPSSTELTPGDPQPHAGLFKDLCFP